MRKLLVLLGVAWIGVTLGAAWLAVDQKVPYDLSVIDDSGLEDHVGEDWLYGWGTGLAAPLAAVAAVAVLTVLASMDRAAGRFGAFFLAVMGGLSVAYMLADQPVHDLLRDRSEEPVQTALVAATLALGALMVLVGFTTWLTAPRERYVD